MLKPAKNFSINLKKNYVSAKLPFYQKMVLNSHHKNSIYLQNIKNYFWKDTDNQ
jgi:hypothetical protein